MAELPHDAGAFTQGLQYDVVCDDAEGAACREVFWESTGLRGRSSVREVDLASGKVARRAELPRADFGEGLTRLGGRLFQLTWQSGKLWSYAVDDLTDAVALEGPLADGWGITTNGTHLIVGDSSATLYFLEPETLRVVREIEVGLPIWVLGILRCALAERSIHPRRPLKFASFSPLFTSIHLSTNPAAPQVKDGGAPVRWLNELEWVDGLIYANVYQTDCLAQVDPNNGGVVGWVQARGLRGAAEATAAADAAVVGGAGAAPTERPDVLNGVAWDAEGGRLFLTGKLWPRVYQVELRPLYRDSKRVSVPKLLAEVRAACIPAAGRAVGR
jgi:glutamine cyclotransferase